MATDPTHILLAQNQAWKKEIDRKHPDFFKESSAKKQSPKALWIGCADSRVPESVITESLPGVIFVQRNIANQFPTEDDNSHSVLEYAVHHLDVDHIIVCGHSKCGGCIAALEALKNPEPPKDPIGRWIYPIVKLAKELGLKEDNDADLERLVQANVVAQIGRIEKTDVIREAWAHGRQVFIHGWEYHLDTGLLTDLHVTIGPGGANKSGHAD